MKKGFFLSARRAPHREGCIFKLLTDKALFGYYN